MYTANANHSFSPRMSHSGEPVLVLISALGQAADMKRTQPMVIQPPHLANWPEPLEHPKEGPIKRENPPDFGVRAHSDNTNPPTCQGRPRALHHPRHSRLVVHNPPSFIVAHLFPPKCKINPLVGRWTIRLPLLKSPRLPPPFPHSLHSLLSLFARNKQSTKIKDNKPWADQNGSAKYIQTISSTTSM